MPEFSTLFAADSIFWALMQNASLLIALGYVHSLFPPAERRTTVKRQLGMGLLLGLIGITVITAAYPFRDGIIFDTRSIVIGITGLYFGAIPTMVAMLVTSAYRLWQGGDGAPIGIFVIFASGLIGLAWRHLRKRDLARIRWRELIAFGYVVHAAMLAIFLAFPAPLAADVFGVVFGVITLPVLGIYPPVTALLGKLLSLRLQRVTDAQRLRHSEERFKLIFMGANDGWWDWDLAKNQLIYSPRWWEMLGLIPGERDSGPDHWRELIHPADIHRVNSRFQSALEAGEDQYEVEARLLHREGHYISVISRGYIQRDDSGRALRVSGTNVDITPMRRALDDANAAKSLLESAGRMGRIGYWEISFENSTLFWSGITAEIHDLPVGTQIPIEEAMSYFPAEYHPVIKRDARRVRTRGETFESEYQIITATGRRIWAQARGEPVRSGDGRITGMRGVFQDVDSQKRAAEALRLSERNYREIFNASTDAIFIHEETSGRILDVNDAMLQMYGFPEKPAALACTITDLCSGEPPYTEADARENIRIVLAEGSHIFPWHARRADGSTFWVEVSLRRTEIGGQNRILANVRDVSKRKALEERVRDAEKMESLGRLAGGIAHDFNNMLGVIIGHTELAGHRLEAGKPVHEDLIQIRHAADRSADLVRQLLTFARRQVITPRVIDFNQSLNTTLKMLRRLIGENIILQWHPDDSLWPVMIDPVQVDQILTNLVLNARDSITGHGIITIRTRNRPDGSSSMKGDFVELEVSDTGSGMDNATLKHVFEPFFTTKSVDKGTGLGLATVHGIVEQNGGVIDVTSQPGRGTRFLILLPRQSTLAAPASSGIQFSDPHGSETILLVEDEPAILFLSTQALTIKGYTVLPAASPVEALEIAARGNQPIDLVISDMIMPGMNGRVLRDEILALRKGLRFLFISGYTDGLTDHLADDRSVDFLAKPFSAVSLTRKAREVLDRPATGPPAVAAIL